MKMARRNPWQTCQKYFSKIQEIFSRIDEKSVGEFSRIDEKSVDFY